ncbi:outer membrane beta-barrel protein [Flavisolibacter ginsenosidimutans]|uniref:Porin family protein n=1 Tax=Flavisolibacter ginsenosidimutans TaxID=661481 RepID=A0A5B8UEN5_9BACT|nr:outer membrane beta-barrel protein [Flavisolibacter ginsenosidimutans]QEC54589.1 porin family protein [Flavisolibacter ginsenosidimutans]
MNDDLHNIDDLFRKGIEGHEEDVPPSVWEAISNDLDKKQASYYKHKYYRVKRASVLLLLLCFLGGVYIIYKESPGRETNSSAHKKQVQTTKTTGRSTENGNPESSAANEESQPTNNGKREKEKTVTSDTVSSSALVPSPAPKATAAQPVENNQSTEVAATTKNQILLSKRLRVPITTAGIEPANNKQQENKLSIINQSVASKGNQPLRNKSFPAQNNLPQDASPSTSRLPLRNRDYATPTIDLKALQANDQSILPPKTVASKNKAKGPQGFSLSVFAAPNIGFDRLEDDDHLAGPGRNRLEAHKQEQKSFSFSAGLLLGYDLTKNLRLQSGISVTSSATTIAPMTVYAKPDASGRTRYELHCSSGDVYISPKGSVQPTLGDSSAKTSGTVSKLTYVSVPVALSYRLAMGKFSLSPGIGAGLNFLTSGKTKTGLSNTNGSESTSASITGLKSNYVDAHLGLGIEYSLGKKLSVGIKPTARLALTPINKETPVKSYQNFLSVETGVRIKL